MAGHVLIVFDGFGLLISLDTVFAYFIVMGFDASCLQFITTTLLIQIVTLRLDWDPNEGQTLCFQLNTLRRTLSILN